MDRSDVAVREIDAGIERGDRRVVPRSEFSRVYPGKDGAAELEILLI